MNGPSCTTIFIRLPAVVHALDPSFGIFRVEQNSSIARTFILFALVIYVLKFMSMNIAAFVAFLIVIIQIRSNNYRTFNVVYYLRRRCSIRTILNVSNRTDVASPCSSAGGFRLCSFSTENIGELLNGLAAETSCDVDRITRRVDSGAVQKMLPLSRHMPLFALLLK